MPLPTWQGQTWLGHTTGKLNKVLTALGLATDDVICLVVESCAEVAAIELPAAGWTQVVNSPQSVGTAAVDPATRLTAWWKRVVTPEADLRTSDPGDHIMGALFWLRGCVATGVPIAISAGDTVTPAQTGVTIPGLTTAVANCMVVAIASHHVDTNNSLFTSASWANASLANLTERINNSGASGNGGGIGIVSGEKAVAGVVSATTGLSTTAGVQARLCLAFQGLAAAPAAVDSDFACGAECQISVPGVFGTPNDHWSLVQGTQPTVQTIIARNGGRAYRFSPVNDIASLWRAISGSQRVARFYVYFASLPSGDCELLRFRCEPLGNSPEIRFRKATNDIVGYVGGQITTPHPVTVGVWYRVDCSGDVSTGTRTMKMTVADGDAAAIDRGTASFASTAATLVYMEIGASCSSLVTADTAIDDIRTGTNPTAYPMGDGRIVGLQVTADGTHSYSAAGDFKYNNITNVPLAATDTWSYLIGALPVALQSVVSAAGVVAGEYLEWVIAGMPAIASIKGVEVISVHKGSTIDPHKQTLRIVDGATVQDLATDASFNDNVGPLYNSRHYAKAPSGVVWTQLLVNGLKFRYGSSWTAVQITPGVPAIGGLMLEVDYIPATAAPPTPVTQQRNPTFTYAAPGTYNVKLTVTDNDGLVGIITKSVTVP